MLVGDVIKLEEDNEVPCDAVVLSSSDANGLCYIQVCCASATFSNCCFACPFPRVGVNTLGIVFLPTVNDSRSLWLLCMCIFGLGVHLWHSNAARSLFADN